MHDLIALSLGAIKSNVVARLADEGLTVGVIAARHRVTPRYVHRLFEREGITYTQYVLRLRLERAYRLLRDPRLAA